MKHSSLHGAFGSMQHEKGQSRSDCRHATSAFVNLSTPASTSSCDGDAATLAQRQADRAFFEANSDRSLRLRTPFPGEVANFATMHGHHSVPEGYARSLVLVRQLSRGFRHRKLMWIEGLGSQADHLNTETTCSLLWDISCRGCQSPAETAAIIAAALGSGGGGK